ncbi:hypothetical protein HS088_TW13G01551 [Tripterygium wilfordii]|uniref:Uncharacterized protein n=1 Tax=Tripterygium wilfordii TaxID=458696 RepID=A0A7J7CX54_TRIWF|nr:hypothetical protein HS088_TW13G01551 [Tripterygium wilfordii]
MPNQQRTLMKHQMKSKQDPQNITLVQHRFPVSLKFVKLVELQHQLQNQHLHFSHQNLSICKFPPPSPSYNTNPQKPIICSFFHQQNSSSSMSSHKQNSNGVIGAFSAPGFDSDRGFGGLDDASLRPNQYTMLAFCAVCLDSLHEFYYKQHC